MSAKQLTAPETSNMYRCLKQQVRHLKVKKGSMVAFPTHGANLSPTAQQLDVRSMAPMPHLNLLA